MSTETTTDEIKAIRVLTFSGLQADWDEWSKKYQGIAAERGYFKVMLGRNRVPEDALNIHRKDGTTYVFSEEQRKEKHLLRKMNLKGYRDLQLLHPSWPSNLFL